MVPRYAVDMRVYATLDTHMKEFTAFACHWFAIIVIGRLISNETYISYSQAHAEKCFSP